MVDLKILVVRIYKKLVFDLLMQICLRKKKLCSFTYLYGFDFDFCNGLCSSLFFCFFEKKINIKGKKGVINTIFW